MTARKRTSTGTRAGKASEPVAAQRVRPEPLRPLGRDGSAMWGRVWDAGSEWISPVTDLDIVQVLCESVDERVRLRFLVISDPEDWRQRARLRELDAQVVSQLAACGFTPAERARLKLAGPKVPDASGKLAQLRAVADERRK